MKIISCVNEFLGPAVIRHSPGGKSAEIRQGCWRKSYSGNLSSSVNPREALKSARTALFKGMVTSTLRNIIRPLYKISGSILAGSPVLTPAPVTYYARNLDIQFRFPYIGFVSKWILVKDRPGGETS